MKVRALRHGQYNNRLYEPGEVFEIDPTPHPVYKVNAYGDILKDENKNPIVESTRNPISEWMQEIKEEVQSKKGLIDKIKEVIS